MRPLLEKRAAFINVIRQFMQQRSILEVETPLLCQHTVTDVHIESFACEGRYLQTSPEYAMKRLLVAGSGAIFQICKAFRKGECGSQHNPEFSMLEWYRPGHDYHDLIQEIDALLQQLLKTKPSDSIRYQTLFQQTVSIDPLTVSLTTLHDLLTQHAILTQHDDIDRDTALQCLMTHCIEPQLGLHKPIFVTDYPASQAALAKLNTDGQTAQRFEAYYKSREIANGWTELVDADEQFKRFQSDQAKRQALGKAIPAIDHFFIDALQQGMPCCSGVAMGVDRLFMLAEDITTITDAISFDWQAV